MPINFRDAQRLVFEFLYQNRTSNNLQLFTGILNTGLVQLAARDGIEIAHADDFIIREALWSLISQGILMQGSRTQGAGIPYVSITQYGIRCYEAGTTLPIDSEGFLDSMNLDDVDEIIKLYIEEAVNCFSSKNYLAAAVMVGGAAERIVEVLTESFAAKLSPSLKVNYRSAVLTHEKIKMRFDKFLEFIETNNIKKVITRTEKETLEGLFPAIVQIIRITRNETGHPTGRQMSRDEAQALIYQLKTAVIFTISFLSKSYTFR